MEHVINIILSLSIIYNMVLLGLPLASPIRNLLDKSTDSLDPTDILILAYVGTIASLLYATKLWVLSLYHEQYPILVCIVIISYGVMATLSVYSVRKEGLKSEKVAAAVGRLGFIVDTAFAGCILLSINLI